MLSDKIARNVSRRIKVYERLHGLSETSSVRITSDSPLSPTPSQMRRRWEERGSVQGNYKVKYARNVKWITLCRFLVSKIIFYEREVTLTDILVLYDLLLHLEKKCSTDGDFARKFGGSLEDLANILKGKRFPTSPTQILKVIRKIGQECESQLEGFFLPKNNMREQEKRVTNMYFLIVDSPLIPRKQLLPPKTFIGKGYGDKGSRRNPAKDGSPHWTDVASVPLSVAQSLFDLTPEDYDDYYS